MNGDLILTFVRDLTSGVARCVAAGVAIVLAAAALHAQSPASADTIAETRRLRDAGKFTAAAGLIAPFARAHPDSAGVAWLAAQTLYWANQPRAAQPLYEHALQLEPLNIELRLDYGRYLVETGKGSRARDVLQIAADDTVGRPRALTLLGLLAYWNGDARTARRLFVDALAADSTLGEAQTLLEEIDIAAAPWVRAGGRYWHDNQPLDRYAVELTGEWHADPLSPFTVRAQSLTFRPVGFENATLVQGELGGSTYVPSIGLDAAAAVGTVQRTTNSSRDWTGRVTIGKRLPANVELRGRIERSPYTSTAASLAAETMVRTFEANADWRSPLGWLAEGVARQERFPDANVVGTGYVWVLAPLVHRAAGDLRAGYGFSYQDSKRSTFVPRSPVPNFPPGQQSPLVAGIYDPYFTPRNLQTHSVIASATRQATRVSWSVNGSYGVSAHDDAPVLTAAENPGAPFAAVSRSFYRRSFNPWMVRGSLDTRVIDPLAIGLSGEHGTGPFYKYTTVRLQATWTFTGAAIRREERD